MKKIIYVESNLESKKSRYLGFSYFYLFLFPIALLSYKKFKTLIYILIVYSLLVYFIICSFINLSTLDALIILNTLTKDTSMKDSFNFLYYELNNISMLSILSFLILALSHFLRAKNFNKSLNKQLIKKEFFPANIVYFNILLKKRIIPFKNKEDIKMQVERFISSNKPKKLVKTDPANQEMIDIVKSVYNAGLINYKEFSDGLKYFNGEIDHV
jgi:hypothetical protein